MNLAIRWGAAPLLALASLVAHAEPEDPAPLSFYGSGLVEWATPPAGVRYDLQVRPETTSYGLGGELWQLESRFDFDVGLFTGAGSGRFLKPGDDDEIWFSFTSSSGFNGLDLVYTITGGAGAFAGATGSGSSLVQLYGNPLFNNVPYGELDGVLNLTLPPVPEPTTTALWALGLAALRRRPPRDA